MRLRCRATARSGLCPRPRTAVAAYRRVAVTLGRATRSAAVTRPTQPPTAAMVNGAASWRTVRQASNRPRARATLIGILGLAAAILGAGCGSSPGGASHVTVPPKHGTGTSTAQTSRPNAAAAVPGQLSWSSPTNVMSGSQSSFSGVSCATTRFCMAVSQGPSGGDAFTYNGSSWSSGEKIDSATNGSSLSAVSCPTSTFCVAVDVAGNAFTYNGSSWSGADSVDNPSSPVGLVSVSCPTISFCMAVDGAGYAITFNGRGWSEPTLFDTSVPVGVAAVSCPTSTFCVAVDDTAGDAYTYTAGTWSQPETIDANDDPQNDDHHLDAVSCASTTLCAATDIGGNAVVFNGTAWSSPENIDAADSADDLNGVACLPSTFCVAVDEDGNASYYEKGTWSSLQAIDGNTNDNSLNAVSCVSKIFCMAVDNDGDAVRGT